MRLRTSLFCVCTFAVVLSACSLTPKEPVKISEPRAVNAEEIASFTPPEMLLMSKTSKIENITYTDIDDDGSKEAFMVFNSAGCGETDKARLVVLKYATTQDMWVHFDTFILAGKQGRIESFSETPSDVTGDGKVDVEIASETNGCGGPWTLYKQLLTLRDGTLVDLTQKSIFSLE